MTRRQWRVLAVAAILLIVVAGAFGFSKLKNSKKSTISGEKPKASVREVAVDQFEIGNVNALIALDGRVSAYEKIEIGAEVTGKLLAGSRTYKPGINFSKGDLLFQIDSQDDRYTLFAQRSNLLNAITQMMPDLKFDYPNSFEAWKWYLESFDVEKETTALPVAQNEQEKYYLAARNIYNLYYGVKSQEERLSSHFIYAPFNGEFLSVNVYPGALISPGMSLGQIMNTSRFELVAPIGMSDLSYLSAGQKVNLHPDNMDILWSGTLHRISKQIDQATQSVPVYFTVTGRGLRDGVFVKGTLNGNNLEASAKIPRSLLVDQEFIWLYEDGKAIKKKVEVVSRTDVDLVVKGLSSEDQVIVSGVNNLFEGQDVILRN